LVPACLASPTWKILQESWFSCRYIFSPQTFAPVQSSLNFFHKQFWWILVVLAERALGASMLESNDSEMARNDVAPAMPVAELLNQMCLKNIPQGAPKQKYRIRHQREDGIHSPLLLQNRVIEAESPERALRIAIDAHGDPTLPIHTMNEYRACAARKCEGKWVDVWEADAESMQYRVEF
jgi:hypothetical protein